MRSKYSTHLYVIVFFASNSALMPFLGFWFSEQGLSNQQIGFLSSLGPLIGLLAQPLWGMLSDKYGIQKLILFVCILITPLIAFGYLWGGSVIMPLVLTSLVYSFFYCAVMPLSDSLVAAHARLYGQSYGSIRVLGSISFGFVIIIIGFIYNRFGLHWMFTANLIMMLLVAGALLGVRSDGERPAVYKGSLFAGALQLLKQRSFMFFLLLVVLMSMGSNFHKVFFPVFVAQLGGDVSGRIGVLNAVSSLGEIPLFMLSGYLIRKFGYFTILAVVAIGGVFRWGLLTFEPSYAAMIVSQAFHGVTFALFMAAGVTFVYHISPDGLKNTGQTLFAVVNMNITNVIASNGGGWILDHSSFAVLFRVGAVCSLVAALCFIALSFKMKVRVDSD